MSGDAHVDNWVGRPGEVNPCSRCREHPSWRTDHCHEMVGPHGECHSPRWSRLEDEHGHRLIAHVSQFDGDNGPGGWIEYVHDGEHFADIPSDALELLALMAEHNPDVLVEMLLYLRSVIEVASR